MAHLSWVSVLVALGVNMTLQFVAPESRIVANIFIVCAALLGITAGCIALFGVRRYGRQGILWPAITGIGLWLLLFALAIPVFLQVKRIAEVRRLAALRKAPPLKPVTHADGAVRVTDSDIGFSFDLPDGYQAFAPSAKPPGYLQAFIKPHDAKMSWVLLVKPLPGTLKNELLRAEELPAGRNASLHPFQWRGLQVDGVRVGEKIGDADYVTFNVQILLRKQAVELGFGGPADEEAHLRTLVEKVLATLDGQTNW